MSFKVAKMQKCQKHKRMNINEIFHDCEVKMGGKLLRTLMVQICIISLRKNRSRHQSILAHLVKLHFSSSSSSAGPIKSRSGTISR